MAHNETHQLVRPISEGTISDWDAIEKIWQRSMFDLLRCDPTEHNFILTEPPMNIPENRELIAEIMFETFGVKGLYIGVQAILALYSNYALRDNFKPTDTLNGCVLDIGDGVAHVIPVCDN